MPGTSEATKDSPSPTPITTGGPNRRATILSRAPEPSGYNLVRLGCRQNAQRKRTGKPLHGAAHGHLKQNWLARGFSDFLDLFDEVRNDLGVGFGYELVALGGEFALQVEIVLHNPVVNHHNAARAVAMRVGIFLCGTPMRRPAGMPNAEGAVQGMLAQSFLQVAELPWSAAHIKSRARWTAHSNARRIVATVFEAP